MLLCDVTLDQPGHVVQEDLVLLYELVYLRVNVRQERAAVRLYLYRVRPRPSRRGAAVLALQVYLLQSVTDAVQLALLAQLHVRLLNSLLLHCLDDLHRLLEAVAPIFHAVLAQRLHVAPRQVAARELLVDAAVNQPIRVVQVKVHGLHDLAARLRELQRGQALVRRLHRRAQCRDEHGAAVAHERLREQLREQRVADRHEGAAA